MSDEEAEKYFNDNVVNRINYDNIEQYEQFELKFDIAVYFTMRFLVKKGPELYDKLISTLKLTDFGKKEEYNNRIMVLKTWNELFERVEFSVPDKIGWHTYDYLDKILSFDCDELKGRCYSISIIDLKQYSKLTGKTPKEILNGYTIEMADAYLDELEKDNITMNQIRVCTNSKTNTNKL